MQAVNEIQFDQMVPIIQKQIKQLQASGGWETISEGKVKGQKKKSQSDSVITKASTVVHIGLEKIVDFFMKNDSFQKINDIVIQNNLLQEKKGKYKIFHFHMKTPFPLDNRQGVSLTTWINEGSKFYIGEKSCNYPVEPNPKFVRAHMHIGGWVFEKIDNNSTKVTNYADIDPRGNIPEFLKNFVAEKRIQELKNLEGILKKQGY